jgi:hypothetical protein
MTSFSDRELREFLLRQAPEELAAAIENAIVLEEDLADRLREQEFDLIDDYAAGNLSGTERGAVERHLLHSPEAAQSLAVARLLPSARRARPGRSEPELYPPAPELPVARRATRGNGARRWLPLAAFAAAAALVTIFVVPRWHRDGDGGGGGVGGGGVGGGGGTRTPALASSPVRGPNNAALAPIVGLLADVNRGAAATPLHWPAGVDAVRLEVETPDALGRGPYALHIEDADGRRLFDRGALAPQSAGGLRYVEAVVPIAALGPGVRRIEVRDANGVLFTRQVIGTPE